MRNSYKIFLGKPKGKEHFQDLGVGGRIILQWILCSGKVWTGFIWPIIGASFGLL
jgi:hypothetical protein